jgi:uncharacterized protein (DUF2235 family)
MRKNLVICCDGTGCEFGEINTNVLRLHAVLENSSQQVTYYHPGLGTMGSRYALSAPVRLWTKLCGLAFGRGLMDDISSSYIFLMHYYKEGDLIYLFGFSRGAYTVRALAAMLHMIGLVRSGNEGLVPYAIQLFQSKVRTQQIFDVAHRFKAAFSHDCKTHFLGAWDTVSSVGWIYDPLNLPFTAHNPDIAILRHAVSIDERRCAFRQNLWQALPSQNSKQVWFAGCHSDVGGSFAAGDNGLCNMTLRWMLREAADAGLRLNPNAPQIAALPNEACAPIHESLTWKWRPLEYLPRRYWNSTSDPDRYRWQIPLARRRYIEPDPVVHVAVQERMQKMGYAPPNLPETHNWEQ